MQKKKNFATSKNCYGKRKEQDVNKTSFYIGKETIHKVPANLRLNGKPIKFMLDSGTTLNVIPATFVKDNKIEHLLKKGNLIFQNTEGKMVRTEGTMRLELIYPANKKKVIASAMVVNEKVQPILSCNLWQKLNLIRFNLDQFASTVSAAECNDLKEQALKNIRQLDIYDSIKKILLEFPDVCEERVGEFEGELTLQT